MAPLFIISSSSFIPLGTSNHLRHQILRTKSRPLRLAKRTTPTAITRRASDIEKYHYPPSVTDKQTAREFRKKQKRKERKLEEEKKESIGFGNRPGAGLHSYDSPYRYAQERRARFEREFKNEEHYKLHVRSISGLTGEGPADSLLELLRARYIERHYGPLEGEEIKLTEDISCLYTQLIDEIHKCDDAYYNNDGYATSRVTDEAYDELIMHLLELERVFPQIIADNSPSANVSHYASEMSVKLSLDEHVQDTSKLKKSQFDGHLFNKMDSMLSFNKTVPIDQKRSEIRYKHYYPMLSLNNAYNHDDIVNFLKKSEILHDRVEVLTELKIDGVALSLEYHNGKLAKASTRGNGRVGDDITYNIMNSTIPGLPKEINSNVDCLIVRGELYIDKEDFKEINKDLERKLSNARNATAGAIQNKDANEINNRRLRFIAYESLTITLVNDNNTDIDEDDDHMKVKDTKNTFDTQYETLINLKHLGFGHINTDYYKVCESIKDIEDYAHFIENERSNLPFEIDGIVLKYNESNLRFELGYTSKSPRGAIAYKFTSQARITTLIDVVYQVSRKGIIVPVAILQPIRIGGAVLSRASLHNFDYINNKLTGLSVGDKIRIERSGDVIPKVISIAEKNKTPNEQQRVQVPVQCPVCNGPVEELKNELSKGGNTLYKCTSRDTCNAQAHAKILHFVNRHAMDITGLGNKTIHKLVDNGLIVITADIFRLTQDDIRTLEGYSKLSSEKLINAIQSVASSRSLHRIIIGLGLPGIGKISARQFAKKIQSLDYLTSIAQQIYDNENVDKNLELLSCIPGIAERSAHALVDYFKSAQNVNELKALAKHVTPCSILDDGDDYDEEDGLNTLGTTADGQDVDEMIKGRTFVFTGKFGTLNRPELMKYIRKVGGRVTSDVSKKTDFVVHGIQPGQKMFKAQRLSVLTVEENEFLQMFEISVQDQEQFKLVLETNTNEAKSKNEQLEQS